MFEKFSGQLGTMGKPKINLAFHGLIPEGVPFIAEITIFD
jgi:hypothetical protein